MQAVPSMIDAPFHAPMDVVLDLPVPPSVNKTRRIDWWQHKRVDKWKKGADGFVLLAKTRGLKLNKIARFELYVTVSETHTKTDLDNILKCLIDYLRHIELIADDSPKHMRGIHVVWGHAPEGCRVTVKACE